MNEGYVQRNDTGATSAVEGYEKSQAKPAEVNRFKNRRKLSPSIWVLVFIILAGFFVRVAVLWETRHIAPILDESFYLLRANGLLDGKGYLGSFQSYIRHPQVLTWISNMPQYRGAIQPPGYPVFMATVMFLTARSVFAVKFAQVILSTLSIWLVYKIGRSWFGHRQGLIAAAICAVYPNLISFSHLIWSETLFVFMLLLVVWLLTELMGVPAVGRSIIVGILFGLLSLTRSTTVYFMPIFFIWLVFVHRCKLAQVVRSVVIMGLTAAFVIMPWTIRNYHVHGGFVLLDSSSPYNLWRGNAPTSFQVRPHPPKASYKPPFQNIPLHPVGEQPAVILTNKAKQMLGIEYPTDLQIMACAKKLAWDYIRSDPVAFLKRAQFKIVDMWNPTSFMIRHFQRGWYGDVDPRIEFVLTWAAVLSYVVVMCLGIFGFILWWRDERAWLIVLMVFFYTAISAVAFGLTRFRIPLIPFVMVLAAHGLYLMTRGSKQVGES